MLFRSVGLMDDHEQMATIGFKAEGDRLWLVSASADSHIERQGHLGQSLWLRECCGREDGAPPPVNLEGERRSGEFVREAIIRGMVNAVHDVADGGILVSVAEMALAGSLGIDLEPAWMIKQLQPGVAEGLFNETLARMAADLFGEDQGRYLVSTRDPEGLDLIAFAEESEISIRYLGFIGGNSISIGDMPGTSGNFAELPLTALREASDSFFRDWMEA